MIAALKGTVIFQGPNYVIVAVHNVGYKVFVGAPMQYPLEQEVSLFTHQHISETTSDLYGFADFQALAFFELLLSVGGIGPKLALNILTGQSIEKIQSSIIASDTTHLQSIAGVGAKLASKIIVELRPKLAKGQADILALGKDDQELIDALAKLGWRRQEVIGVIRQLPQGELHARLKSALKLLGG
ncbi:Holliday junction branch migration protein RuvA [Candidatus Berkelbacteria bacterium]|nr:Holliday junction branch migration protein RuvA [Candidatus Berkelbacteria bacterium]